MSELELETPRFFRSDKYEDGLTKQGFKDSADINKILAKAAKGGTISHLAKHGATYGDFSQIDDLMAAHVQLEKGRAVFAELPGELRREFDNDMAKFFNYVNDPANAGKLEELLPKLAEPGNDLPQIKHTIENPPTEPPAAAAATTAPEPPADPPSA